MKPATCPYRPDQPAAAAAHPPGTWPPGPPAGLTGWGLLRQMARDLPTTLNGWHQQYGDLVHLKIWPEHQIMVAGPALVRELLVTHHDSLVRWERGMRVFSQLHGNSVLTAEGEAWKAKRQALQPSFSPKGVRPLLPLITAAAADSFAQWPGDGVAPIEQGFTAMSMDVILRIVFTSVGDADTDRLSHAVHDTAVAAQGEMFWPASWPDWMPWKGRKRRALRLLKQLVDGRIAARLAQPSAQWPDDLLSRLLALHQAEPARWPLRAVHDDCMTAFLAGHETTAATLTWWAWCMAAHPQAQARAQAEVDALLQGRLPTADDLPALAYLHLTLQETLRLYPATPMLLTRRAVRPIALGGWTFAAGTMFSIPTQAMHHDARWFADPLAFRPERFAEDETEAVPRGAFMPLGTGPRVCLGQHLAMAEMTAIAAMFLQRYTVAPAPDASPPEPAFHITLRPREPLRLLLQAR
jgi:cytochrome P450